MNSHSRLLDLVIVLTQKELKSRYKNLGLGYFWSLGSPLAFALVYYSVFKFVMRVKIESFPLFLVSGMFAWQWFTNSLAVASMTYIGNAPLIKKVNFPRNLLPLVVAMQDMIHFFAAIPIIFVLMIIFHKSFSPLLIIGIPILGFIQLLYTYSLGLLISTVNVFFRDLERLVTIFITFLFYLTPIVYSPEMIPEKFQPYLILNPVAPLMINWRNLFMDGTLNWSYVLLTLGYGLLFLCIAQPIYNRLSWRFAEVL
jgi:lipopolysaccharide transport system permease protein